MPKLGGGVKGVSHNLESEYSSSTKKFLKVIIFYVLLLLLLLILEFAYEVKSSISEHSGWSKICLK